MDHAHPLRGLFAPAMAATLEVLIPSGVALTGREVHRMTRQPVSLGAVQKALETLTEMGLVTIQPAGRAYLYSYNREHVMAEPLVALTQAGSAIEGVLRERLGRLDPAPRAAWLFGSAARGDTTRGSDIDVAVVRPGPERDGAAVRDAPANGETAEHDAWSQALTDLTSEVLARSGNPCEILEMTESELTSAVERGDPIIDELRRDARPLVGERPRALLGGGAR